ncbi:DUF732 domain-containing protein [Mycobacterium asiaticum]|uniref:DUF732 domain-containing protein n=1 Tax=Mycobacterium asiaticum TaxID=1790 RepID=A0A1A3KN92_MYCAS|nr:DUF732 domain-containing protein [Mycobacterium asiaticum]OBJ86495.1 hypothetical protein A5640_11055 [Mycobacterium asiaticum]
MDDQHTDQDEQHTDAALTRPAEPTPTAWSDDDEPGAPAADDGRKPLPRSLLGFLALVLFTGGGVAGWILANHQHLGDRVIIRQAPTTTTTITTTTAPAPSPDPITARRDAEFLRTARNVQFVTDDPARGITIAHQICAMLSTPATHLDSSTQINNLVALRINTDYSAHISLVDAGVIAEAAQLVYCPETIR